MVTEGIWLAMDKSICKCSKANEILKKLLVKLEFEVGIFCNGNKIQ